jgi:hypothetical protein
MLRNMFDAPFLFQTADTLNQTLRRRISLGVSEQTGGVLSRSRCYINADTNAVRQRTGPRRGVRFATTFDAMVLSHIPVAHAANPETDVVVD